MDSERDADGRRVQQPAQQNMFEGSNGSDQGNLAKKPKHQPANLKGTQSLERLKSRIELTVKELARLRSENAALQKQLQEAQSHGLEVIDGTPVLFSESPAALRAKIEHFIGAIDRYLEEPAGEGDDRTASTDSSN